MVDNRKAVSFSVSSMSATTRQARISFAIGYDFEKVTVRIEKIETIVIAPVNRPVGRDATLREPLLCLQEIVTADLESVMPPPQGILDPVSDSWWQVWSLEQSEHLLPTTQKDLMMSETVPYRKAKDFGVKSLGPVEVQDIEAEMIEFEESHDSLVLLLPSVYQRSP
jgi:hypothetical protein